ncbi:MAG: DUF2059 domain-containing protein [Burkholderiales bacterium]|nr:DUF2059 domain-containing protein [Burkholderiales bacterium]
MKNKLFVATTTLAIFIGATAVASAEDLTAAKRAQIKTLLEITNLKAIPEQLANSTIQSWVPGVKQLDPKFPDKGFTIARDAFAATLAAKADTPGGLVEQVTLVYHNAFTAAEINDIVKFYQGASGKKLLASQGKVNGDTYQAAMKWADSLSGEVDKNIDAALKKEGLKLPDPPKAPAAPAAGASPAPAGAAQPPAKK